MAQTFKDASGSDIPFRLRVTRGDEHAAPSDVMTCELDPHASGQWIVMGRGSSVGAAFRAAQASWLGKAGTA